MPNQLSDKNQRVTVALPKELVKKIDQRADTEERSRSQVILRMLRDEIKYANGLNAAEDPADYPQNTKRTPPKVDLPSVKYVIAAPDKRQETIKKDLAAAEKIEATRQARKKKRA